MIPVFRNHANAIRLIPRHISNIAGWYNSGIGMDKNHPVGDSAKSKILLIVLIVLTVISIGYTFWKTVVQQDFEFI